MRPEIAGLHSWNPGAEMLAYEPKELQMCILWCFPSFPFSSCDKADMRFPQAAKQKHLWESESILQINLDAHFSSLSS